MDLIKKTVIITGSGRGIGKDIALALAKEGCNVGKYSVKTSKIFLKKI